jgi:hypothetical protein
LAAQLLRQPRSIGCLFLLIADWGVLDFSPVAPVFGSLDQSLLRSWSFHMHTGDWVVHGFTAFRSFNHSTNEATRFGHREKKKFELCEKARPKRLSRVRNQKPSVSIPPGLVGLCWAKMRWVFSGDSSDEACGDCRTIADRVGDVGKP